jgi:hypothetical protein
MGFVEALPRVIVLMRRDEDKWHLVGGMPRGVAAAGHGPLKPGAKPSSRQLITSSVEGCLPKEDPHQAASGPNLTFNSLGVSLKNSGVRV